jgi:hypothetical protein
MTVTVILLCFVAAVSGTVAALRVTGVSIRATVRLAAGRFARGELHPSAIVTVLFVAAVLTLDFSPLAVYRYFLFSDVLLLAAFGVQCWIDRRIVIYLPALLTAAFVAYLGGLLAGSAAAQDVTAAPTWLHFAFSMLLLTPAVTTLLVRRPDLRLYLPIAIVVTATVQALIVLAQVIKGLQWQSGTRITGALGAAGLWVYAAAIVALAGAILTSRFRLRVALIASLSVIAFAELLMRSRMLWIVSIVGACLMMVLQSRRRTLGLLAASVLCVVGMIGYWAGLYPDAIARRIADALRPSEASDLVARLDAVRELAPALADSGAIGIGFGRSEGYLRDRHSPASVVNIHNVVLHAAVEGGVLASIGVLMLPLAICVLWRSATPMARAPSDRFVLYWLVSTLLAIFVGAQLTPTLYEHTFYALLAALASCAADANDGGRFHRVPARVAEVLSVIGLGGTASAPV